MSLLFIYDMTMYEKNNLFYNYMFSPSLLDKYKLLDNDFTICCNYEKSDVSYKMNCISGCDFDKVELMPLKRKNMLKYFKVNKVILENRIKSADKIIIRVPSFVSFLAIDLCNKYHKNYLVEHVGCPFDAYWNHSLIGKVIAIPFYFKTKSIIKKSQNVVYVTNEFLQKRYPTDGMAYSCSDVEIPKIKEKERELNNKKIKLCTIASMEVKYKGQQYVIKALAKMRNSHIEYHLIGQGDGKKLKGLIKKYSLNDNIKVIGALSHDEVLAYLSKMDIYIQPSLQEGLPRTVVEAMSLGLPVTGSNVGGIPELVSEKAIFKKKNIRQIIEKINYLIDPFNYVRESKRSLSVAKEYDQEKLKERKDLIYKHVFQEDKRT